MPAPFIRIALRYLAAALVAWGYLAEDQAALIADDPDLVMALTMVAGWLVGAFTEVWYYAARKFGWEK